MDKDKKLYLERAFSYFIKMVIVYTTILSLAHLAVEYNRFELIIINLLFIISLTAVGIIKLRE